VAAAGNLLPIRMALRANKRTFGREDFTRALDEPLLTARPAAAVIRSEGAEDPWINRSGAQGLKSPRQSPNPFWQLCKEKFAQIRSEPISGFPRQLRHSLLNRCITGCDRGMVNRDHAHGQDPKRSPATTEPLPLEGHLIIGSQVRPLVPTKPFRASQHSRPTEREPFYSEWRPVAPSGRFDVGLDNRSAGRTAGYLTAWFIGPRPARWR
jgi:hypothetical protein